MENLNYKELASVLEKCNTLTDKHFLGIEKFARKAIKCLIVSMFPYHFGKEHNDVSIQEKREQYLQKAYYWLKLALDYVYDDEQSATQTTTLIKELPIIYEYVKTDLQAAYEGDPAAKTVDEIILSYPAFKAITAYRVAHKLYEMNVPYLPRIITEFAHEMTGIDIHPGATIGKYFFIDHGTGVVIGETTTIGDHVKLYQHVTLGAKSFEVNEDGTLVKGTKRHPDLGNHVVVYAGATILGGNTFVGDNSVIGGNVWLTHSVEPNTIVTQQSNK